jgi:hypothetical protein
MKIFKFKIPNLKSNHSMYFIIIMILYKHYGIP